MEMNYAKTVEKWGTLEVTVKGPKEGNPFCDQWIKGTFECKNEKKTVDGFYDGDGVYKVRFMPSFVDTYTFKIESSFQAESAEEVSGSFEAAVPSADNHGPVRVAGTYYLAYEDGKPYHCIGTTCYVWNLQNEKLQDRP